MDTIQEYSGFLVPTEFNRTGHVSLNLNEMASRVHKANEKWWVSLETGEKIVRNKVELLSLMQSEVSEALEGERKRLMDDKLPHRPMAEVEIADVLIRTLDYAGGFGLNLKQVIPPEMTNNRAESLFRITRSIDLVEYLTPLGRQFEELAVSRVISACFEYCKKFEYDLMGAYEEKMNFNAIRPDHKLEARRAEGGKAF